MNNFDVKDFEQLHRDKIRNGLDIMHPISSYFFCIDTRILFIKKSRRFYQVCGTSSCGFIPVFRQSCFDVFYSSTDISETITEFYRMVKKMVTV